MHVAPILFVALLSSPLTAAEIYRWVDSQGNVHFDAQPRPGAKPVEVRPQIIQRDEATREREARTERFFEARRQEQQAADQAANEEHARREQACRQLRQDLSRLSHGGRYFRTDAKDGRVYYSDEEIGAARRQLASRITRNCS
ncbi:hypothetical protein CH92_05095 [Stutzerimonas stutzeri]|uniref:DUF4124 domain-containing protein n=1 Tax=Stutzerimonas stutzeri TaxID=316 RepID=W8QVB2_STUST|nr:DUF4124 domain-containing protein [Stutzerimonas stutzeri]AHL74500.1 hypothetical protein CH92_05095 [Stutzerimonas stutzeri]MCQ4329027.1 DUF4124 domain-containing protein [Stutzerimonas stutzeri]